MCKSPAVNTTMGVTPNDSTLSLPSPAPNTLTLPPKAQNALAVYNPMSLIEKEDGPKPQKYSEVDIDGLIRALKNPPEQIVDLYIHYCPRIKSDTDNCSVSLTLADHNFVRRLLYRFEGPDRTQDSDHKVCSKVITALVASPAVSSVTLEIDYVQSDVIVAELCTALHTNRTLQKLSVYSDNRFQQPLNSECVKHIAEMFLVNTGIRELQLGLIDINLQVADNIALALRRNRSLQGLTLYARIDSDALAILTKPFSGQEPNQTLQKLEIKGFKCLGARGDGQIGNKGAEHIATILCRNTSLKEVALKNCMIDSLGVQTLALALLTNKNLEVLDLSYNPLDVDGLKEIVKTITMDPATQIQPNTTFREIIIRHSFISRAGAAILANMLKTNKTLVRLDLQFSVRLWTPKDVLMVLRSLKNNQSLRFLDLRGCEGVDGAKIRDTILDLLVTNPWLEQVGVEGTPLSRKGHDAVIKAQLRRNAEKFTEVFKGMGTVTPNSARVFLCGIPFAGKTTFRKTMVYSNIKRTSSSVRVKTSAAFGNSKIFKAGRKESQTIGIEVQVIVEDNVQISIWDLAGHEEFHAFHDLVVPNLSSQGSACTFVLLCDISVPQGKGGSKFELKEANVIDQELRYWLRFIASNSRQSLHMLPNVTVIFTHSDKFPKIDLIAYCKQPVEKLRVQFQRVINITEFHVCDARSRKSIEPVQKAMQKRIVSILDRVPKVFDACSQLQTKLNEWKNQHPDKPLIKWSDFTLLCSKVPALKRLQGQDANIADERAKAVARAMHDAGELLYFDGLDFMVVDPNWFCHEIMGRILSLDSSLLVLKQPLIDRKGYTKREHLKKVLEASFCKNKNPLFKGRKVRGVIPEDLVQLMVKLNLCFEVNPGDKTSGIVIPASLSNLSEEAARGERRLCWPLGYNQVPHDELLHIGWRLKCEDPDVTILTLGFFPRLQVFLQRRFAGVSDALYTIEKNFITFVFSGLEFLIEYHGPEDCQVDILVRSSKDFVETWATVDDSVLKPTLEFCASPTEGCQGVVLIEEIMRPQCVRELWVRKKRTKDQCIGVEVLKQKVLASSRLDYEYIWKKSMEESHGLKADRAEDLLGPENWEDVLNRYLDSLEKIDFEVNSKKSSYDMNNPLSPPTPQPSRRIGRTVSLLPRPSEMTRQLLESRLTDRSMEVEVYQKRLFPELSRNIDNVIDFPFLLQDAKVPHLVYLSTGGDSANSERLLTKLVPGSYSRKLHLMCEHRDGIHMIDHQVGGIVRCDEKSVRSVRPHMLWGLKLISALMRISELAAGGFYSMLTEAERMRLMGMVADDDATDLVEWPDVTGRLSFTPEEMMAAEDWLIHYMKSKNIPALFGLYKVVYLDDGMPSKHTAWICDKHVKYGLHHGTVQMLPM